MTVKEEPKICGVVMPIASMEGYKSSHWQNVREIIYLSAEKAGFKPQMVSDSEDIGVILKRIVQNLYDNPIVVCDVSANNPNVMFELGLRLAFDKPTIIIKDHVTKFSFDIGVIEHLEYPADLRWGEINDFKDKLSEKIKATHDKANSDSQYSTFLKSFGEFTVAKIEKKEVTGQEALIEELKEIKSMIKAQNNNVNNSKTNIHIEKLEHKIDDDTFVRYIQEKQFKKPILPILSIKKNPTS